MTLLSALVVAPPSLAIAAPQTKVAAVTTEKNIPYGQHPDNQLDAGFDATKTGKPWVMLVHSGSWMGGNKTDLAGTANRFTAQGFAAFSVNYRLSMSYGWPAQPDDVLAAVKFVRANALRFGIDANRGALYGESAGGHLATTVAMKYGLVRAVVGVSSVLQPLSIWQYAMGLNRPAGYRVNACSNLAGWAALLFRGPPIVRYSSIYNRWRDGTPQNHLNKNQVPVMEFHSKDDAAVPIRQAQNFINAANASKAGRGILHVAPGDHHDSWGALWSSPARTSLAMAFLKSQTKASS